MPDFDTFDWSDDRWQAYYSGLFPQPSMEQTLRFKRKWFKREIDPEFNDELPETETAEAPKTAAPTTASKAAPTTASKAAPPATKAAGSKSVVDSMWTIRMGVLGCLTSGVVLSLLGMVVPGTARAVGCLTMAMGFVGALILKCGVPKFNAAYWQVAFSSDSLHALMMLMAAIPVLGSPFAIASPILSAVMEAGTLSEGLGIAPQLSKSVNSQRYELCRWRARMEVVQGALLIIDVFRGRIRFMQPFVYWHTLRLKTNVDPFLGEVFRSFHMTISKGLSHPAVPQQIGNFYAKIYEYLSR